MLDEQQQQQSTQINVSEQIELTQKNNHEQQKIPDDQQHQSTKGTTGKKKSDEPMHFEDAITLTKFGIFNYILIIVCGIILSAVLFETLGISFVLPVSECDLRLTNRDKGVVSAVGFAGVILSSHLWGFLADTKGRRKIILPSLLISFTCSIISSFLNNFILFALVRFFTGFFVSGSSATIYAYLGEFHNTKYRARSLLFASVIFGLACTLLPIIAWLVINTEWEFLIPIINVTYKPWRLFLVVCSLPSLICALALIFFPESPKFVLSQGKQTETIEILQKIHRINRNSEPLVISSIHEEIETIESRKKIAESKDLGGLMIFKLMWSQTAPLFMRPHLKYTTIACVLQFGIYVTANGMYMWFPDILNRVAEYVEKYPSERITICDIVYATKLNLTAITAMNKTVAEHSDLTTVCVTKLENEAFQHTFVLEILYSVGFAFIGLIINAVGKLAILVVVYVGCGVCGILIAYVTNPILSIYIYLILLLAALGTIVVNAATVDLFPTNLRAMAVCISLMMGRTGSLVGTNIAGFMIDDHCHEMFIFCGISLIFCAILSFFIPKPSKEKDVENTNEKNINDNIT